MTPFSLIVLVFLSLFSFLYFFFSFVLFYIFFSFSFSSFCFKVSKFILTVECEKRRHESQISPSVAVSVFESITPLSTSPSLAVFV